MENAKLVKSIRNCCKENGITVSQLEKELNFGAGLISRWTKTDPSLGKIINIADYFNINIDELIGRELKSNSVTSDQFLESLYNMTLNKTLIWKDCSNLISKLDDDDFFLKDEGYDKQEIFNSSYNYGFFWLYCQYDNEKGNISDISVEIYIQPDKNSNPVLQPSDEKKAENLWLYIHTLLFGTLDEIKAEELRNEFIKNSQDPLEKVKDDPIALKQIYDEVIKIDPEFVRVINKLNTPEMQMMQKLYSNPEFREVSLQANRIAHMFKGIE